MKPFPSGCILQTVSNHSWGAVARVSAVSKTASGYKATVILVIGSAHTGHGGLRLSFDDHLTSLGAPTFRVNVTAQKVPLRRDWGLNHSSSDFRISDPMELASLLSKRYPEM